MKAVCTQVSKIDSCTLPEISDKLYTAMRQTWEEIGVDLAEKDFMLVGQLDDREITTSLGKRLLMILSPFGEQISIFRN